MMTVQYFERKVALLTPRYGTGTYRTGTPVPINTVTKNVLYIINPGDASERRTGYG
jgi:hypothetical protein